MFAALVAPASMLAEEVRTGKLGGLCSVQVASSDGAQGAADADGEASVGAHCDLCGSLVLPLPPPASAANLPVARTAMAAVFDDAVRSAFPPGLPFSRGPPLL
jgi:hypothetical protein